jgi:hypothetical protein
MKDIKIKKIKVNKIEEKVEKLAPELVEEETQLEQAVLPKRRISIFSAASFAFMGATIIVYVFMISSSVFYAVKANQYNFKGDAISSTVLQNPLNQDLAAKANSSRISYINKDSDTSISLK